MANSQSADVDDDNVELTGTDYPDSLYMVGTIDSYLLDEGEAVAEAFPDYDVFVSAGPYRPYGVQYGVRYQEDIIWLDYYSVRPNTGKIDDIVADIHDHLEQRAADASPPSGESTDNQAISSDGDEPVDDGH